MDYLKRISACAQKVLNQSWSRLDCMSKLTKSMCISGTSCLANVTSQQTLKIAYGSQDLSVFLLSLFWVYCYFQCARDVRWSVISLFLPPSALILDLGFLLQCLHRCFFVLLPHLSFVLNPDWFEEALVSPSGSWMMSCVGGSCDCCMVSVTLRWGLRSTTVITAKPSHLLCIGTTAPHQTTDYRAANVVVSKI